MQHRRMLIPFATLVALSLVFSPALAHAAAPSFAISAGNVTMPSTGLGSTVLTATSENGYSGELQVTCAPADAPMGAKLPLCVEHPGSGFMLAANKTAEIGLILVPYGQAPPPTTPDSGSMAKNGVAATLTLAGALVFGFGLGGFGFRRRAGWLRWIVLAAAVVTASAGISACGGGGGHGTYVYNVVATDNSTKVSASTTINVTLP